MNYLVSQYTMILIRFYIQTCQLSVQQYVPFNILMIFFHTGGSPYSEGGGLYALGLIHANHGGNIIEYLLGQLKEATDEVSCLLMTLMSHW